MQVSNNIGDKIWTAVNNEIIAARRENKCYDLKSLSNSRDKKIYASILLTDNEYRVIVDTSIVQKNTNTLHDCIPEEVHTLKCGEFGLCEDNGPIIKFTKDGILVSNSQTNEIIDFKDLPQYINDNIRRYYYHFTITSNLFVENRIQPSVFNSVEALDKNIVTQSVLDRVTKKIETIVKGNGDIVTRTVITNISYLGYMSKAEFSL